MTEKTFIHHDGALGDALLSLPCIGKIKADAGSIHFAGRPDVAGLFKTAGIADDASSADNAVYASLHGDPPEAAAKGFLSTFGRAFVFTVNSGSRLVANIAASIPETRTVVTIPPEGARIHAAKFRLDQLGRYCDLPDARPALRLPVVYRRRARELLAKTGKIDVTRPLITMHPGSGGRGKCWPLENYFGLARRLINDHAFSVVLFTGPAEDYGMKTKIDRFVQGHRGAIHVPDEKLPSVAALIDMSRVYIGNDSGITHLAAAMNGNVVALFGPSDPLVWKPLGRRVRVVSDGLPDGQLSEIAVDEVYERVMFFPDNGEEMQ